jgi:membrane-associated phospholipid phosphatase
MVLVLERGRKLNDNRAAEVPWWDVAFVLAGLGIAAVGVAPYDQEVSAFFGQRRWPSDLKRLIDLSEVMAHGLAVAVILLLIHRVALAVRPQFWWLVACPLAGGLGANLGKLLVSRIRPYRYWELQATADSALSSFVGWLPVWESNYLRESWRQSFPSGHTATAFAFAVGLSWVFPRGRFLFYTLATLAGIQRLVSNSHWPSDVLAGAAVGLLCGCLVKQVAVRQIAVKQVAVR